MENRYQEHQSDFKYLLIINDDLECEIKIRREGNASEKNLKDNIFTIKEASDKELEDIGRIYDLFDQFAIENTRYEKIQMDKKAFIKFALNIKPILRDNNAELISSKEIIESDLKLIMDTDLKENEFSLKKLNRIKWIVRLNKGRIALRDFDKQTENNKEILITRNYFFILNRNEFLDIKFYASSLLKTTENSEILKLALSEEIDGFKFEVGENLKRLINPSRVYEVPRTLKGELRTYQKIGYSWLVQNIRSGFGSILADDMGLGKTLQVLTALLYFKEKGLLEERPSLIVVPPTLISNWEHEIRKFTPELSYYIYHGTNRRFPLEDYDIVLSSYGVIRNDLDLFLDKEWFLYILDEAQNIKSPHTQQTKAIKEVNAYNKIALTGTPIENRLTDYWSIFDFTNKGYLSSLSDFKDSYVFRIERLEDERSLENFLAITKPFVMRRLKTDEQIKGELPDRIVNDIYASLSKKQIKLYNAVLDGIFEEIDELKGIERRGTILKTITSLKQTCNHPAQFLGSGKPKIKESGKMELLITILENIMDMDEKVLIFTQYVKMGEIIQDLVSKKLKREVLFLHGSQSRSEKAEIIDRFQEDDNYKILVATLKTGGVGLNLTAASNVIHYDLWWNPAVENQATDRVHRIGQEKDVMVYRFITKGTLEEEIDSIIKTKLDLAEKAISVDETFITEMTTEELKRVLSLRL